MGRATKVATVGWSGQELNRMATACQGCVTPEPTALVTANGAFWLSGFEYEHFVKAYPAEPGFNKRYCNVDTTGAKRQPFKEFELTTKDFHSIRIHTVTL